MNSRPILQVAGLAKSFAGVKAVDDVSFDVQRGAVTALIGPNGAGKTTVFNLITNVYEPDEGDCVFDGEPITALSPTQVAARGVVRTFQSARIFPTMTVLENVLSGAHLRFAPSIIAQMLRFPSARHEETRLRQRARDLLALTGLVKSAERSAASLPMGEQKVVEIARALMASPEVLLLDEPAAGLNDAETADVASLISAVGRTGITVVVVEHNMSLVMSIAHQIVVMDAGRKIAEGTPREVRSNPAVIAAYLGSDHDA